MLRDLDALLEAAHLPLFVPVGQAAQVQHAHLVAETALSGGNLEDYLGDLLEQYPGRLAAALRPISADYRLPAQSSEGTPLSRTDRVALQQKYGAQSFFSRDLCAKYFTYQQDGQAHFVLFDDADTIRCKLNLGKKMAFPYAFLLCSEVEDLLEELRRN